jgi:hypothetical protein
MFPVLGISRTRGERDLLERCSPSYVYEFAIKSYAYVKVEVEPIGKGFPLAQLFYNRIDCQIMIITRRTDSRKITLIDQV